MCSLQYLLFVSVSDSMLYVAHVLSSGMTQDAGIAELKIIVLKH